MASIFSKIAAGEIPSYKCAESDKFYAFLDISPMPLLLFQSSHDLHQLKKALLLLRASLASVSYTHLDVYKRQIKRSVQAENIEADFCNTGKEGLQKLREQEYQLVVCLLYTSRCV